MPFFSCLMGFASGGASALFLYTARMGCAQTYRLVRSDEGVRDELSSDR